MIQFDDMDTQVEELETDTKCGKSKIRRLDQYDDRSLWKRNKFILDRLYLRIDEFLLSLSF